MWVAVDAESSEVGPNAMAVGAAMAVRELGAKVILVGNRGPLEHELKNYPAEAESIRIEHTTEVVGMEESPAKAIRSKKDASVCIAARLVKEGEAIGFFSPGNTGATMAAALMILGRIDGVKRPAIATPIPREDGIPTVLLDSGANVDCKPEYLVQFAIMGEIYCRSVLNTINPKIGLLVNGSEDKKGNETSLEAFKILKKLPYNFIGNVESKDLFGIGRDIDVAVCDGMIGNICLKTVESTAKTIFNTIKEGIKKSNLAKTGALLLKPTLMMVKHRLDPSTYGGAPLLGIDGTCLIGHGSSNARAVMNAIKYVRHFSSVGVEKAIADAIGMYHTH